MDNTGSPVVRNMPVGFAPSLTQSEVDGMDDMRKAPPLDPNFLDALLAESKALSLPAPVTNLQLSQPLGLDDFLNDLIGESQQDKADRESLKEKRKKAKNTALPGSTIHTLRNEIRELEYRAEWSAVADVIWIKRCICDQCGSETPQFAGYFRKSYSRLSKVNRYTALSAEVESSLPREIKTEMTTVAMCADCIPQILMEDGWLTADIPQESIESDIDAEELCEELDEETEEYQGQEGNLIETEEDLDPPFKE